ncbi:hypothetical protein YC2023_059705 [Brassica napus]
MAARSDEQMSLLLSSFDQIDELEHRTKCHVLKEELKRVNDEKRRKEHVRD